MILESSSMIIPNPIELNIIKIWGASPSSLPLVASEIYFAAETKSIQQSGFQSPDHNLTFYMIEGDSGIWLIKKTMALNVTLFL